MSASPNSPKPKSMSKFTASSEPLNSFLANSSDELSLTDGSIKDQELFELPNEPRAVRDLESEQTIPLTPPYVAIINNLPFDAVEEEVRQLFNQHNIHSLRLPRDERKSKRMAGFAYMEFQTREDLIALLKSEAPMCRGRRVRIDVSNDDEWEPMESCDDGPAQPPYLDDMNIYRSEEEFPMLKPKQQPFELDSSASTSSSTPLTSLSSFDFLAPSNGQSLSEEELEERMQLRLQKLAEYENGQSSQSSDDVDEEQQCWRDFWNELQQSQSS